MRVRLLFAVFPTYMSFDFPKGSRRSKTNALHNFLLNAVMLEVRLRNLANLTLPARTSLKEGQARAFISIKNNISNGRGSLT